MALAMASVTFSQPASEIGSDSVATKYGFGRDL